jgi:hypothetical protein
MEKPVGCAINKYPKIMVPISSHNRTITALGKSSGIIYFSRKTNIGTRNPK